MRSPIGIGIVGLGRIAGAHILAARALQDEVEVVAVATRNPKKKEVDDLSSSVTVFEDVRDLVQDPRVDAVVVCTPNHAHAEAVEVAAAAGKHVLVEKPIALTESEAFSMVTRCEQAGVTLMVAQSRRFSQAIHRIRAMMHELGTVYRADIDFLVRFPGPATPWWTRSNEAGELILHLQGSHSLDTLAWLFDGLPGVLYCHGSTVNPAFGGLDEADILMQYPEGLLASVSLSLNSHPAKHDLNIYGENGTLTLTERMGSKPFSFEFEVRRDGIVVFEENGPSVYTNQLREFSSALRENQQPNASGREILKSARLVDAAVASYRQRGVVELK